MNRKYAHKQKILVNKLRFRYNVNASNHLIYHTKEDESWKNFSI